MYTNNSFWRLKLINVLCKPYRKFNTNKIQMNFVWVIFLNDSNLLCAKKKKERIIMIFNGHVLHVDLPSTCV